MAKCVTIAQITSADGSEINQEGEEVEFLLRRGQDTFVSGRRVLVVDDVVNTGYSIMKAMQAVREAGGEVVGAAAWISRGNVSARDLGVDNYVFLDEVSLPSWPAEGCGLCADGVPVNVTFAHGAEFVAANS